MFIACVYVFANTEVVFLSQRARVVEIGLTFISTCSLSGLVSKITITPVLRALFGNEYLGDISFLSPPSLLVPITHKYTTHRSSKPSAVGGGALLRR